MSAFLVDLNLPETEIIKTEKDEYSDILITIRTTKDSGACRVCGKRIYKRHASYRDRKLKLLPVLSDQTFIIYSSNRLIYQDCKDHPTTTVKPSWHSTNGSHTTAYENHLLMEMVNSIIADVAVKECSTEESILGVVER